MMFLDIKIQRKAHEGHLLVRYMCVFLLISDWWQTLNLKSIWNATDFTIYISPTGLQGGCGMWHRDSFRCNEKTGGKNKRLSSKCCILFSEFVGRDRPRQLALNGSTTEYHLKNVAHDTEYVLTLYVLFGSVVGPGITATFRTCE